MIKLWLITSLSKILAWLNKPKEPKAVVISVKPDEDVFKIWLKEDYESESNTSK